MLGVRVAQGEELVGVRLGSDPLVSVHPRRRKVKVRVVDTD